MPRLLLIESSPTLRHGMQKVLARPLVEDAGTLRRLRAAGVVER